MPAYVDNTRNLHDIQVAEGHLMRRGLLIVVSLLIGMVYAQGQTLVDLRSQTKNVDFSSALSTKPFRAGVSLPLTCSVGEAFLNLNALPGQNLYICVANTWTVQAPAALPSLTGNSGKVLSNDGGSLQWRGFGGDLSGSPDAALVNRIQGRLVNPSAPLQGQLLRWDGVGNQWSPSTESVGSVFGRTGTVAAQNGDYAFTQIAGTLSLTQGGTGATSSAGALASIGAAAVVHTHVLTDLVGVAGKQGTAQSLQMFGGGTVNTNDCAKFDATGNLISAGAACGAVIPNYAQSFTSQTSVTLTHNLNSSSVIVQCFDNSSPPVNVEWGRLTLTDANNANVAFVNAQSGKCVVNSAGGGGGGSGGSGGSSSVLTGIGLAGSGTSGSPLTVDTTAVPTRLSATATLTFAAIAQSACIERTITLTGAATGDEVMLGPPPAVDQGFLWGGYVSSTNTVTVRMCKITSGTVTPAALAWRATIVRTF